MDTYRKSFIEDFMGKLVPYLNMMHVHFGEIRDIQYGIQVFATDMDNGEELLVNIYKGKDDICIVPNRRESDLYYKIIAAVEEVRETKTYDFQKYAGTDESGKSDYFGPLAIAGFICDSSTYREIAQAGVKDSKKLEDSSVLEYARFLQSGFPGRISLCIITPQQYNELYSHFRFQGKNMNSLLAWGHARVIEELVKKDESIEAVIADQFGNSDYLEKSLYERGKRIRLIQKTKAESDVAVAAASIIARDAFLDWLNKTSETYDVQLPKGACDNAVKAAAEIADIKGVHELRKLVKLHFRNTRDVLKIINKRKAERI